MPEHSNRLIHQTSPYLLQHAHNPVDWQPWDERALAQARREDKPILLSIGYSACHWCHVMERESFEDEQTARLMNENFICIKVDREERPDLDHIYMNAVQMLTGRGGWPLTVFLLPDGRPFYGGTYFPPEDRHGMPGLRRLLLAIAAAYRDRRGELDSTVKKLMSGLHRFDRSEAAESKPAAELLTDAAARLARAYDEHNGGLGQAPKFPNASVLDLFLRAYHAGGDETYLQMVLHTLRQMARGGIYDHLGGGFHRYSVDEAWAVPHFEKMLYDNAQLVPLYLCAYQLSGELPFATVVRETLDYVLREMCSPDGAFYSTQDADSEGEEGKFFAWQPSEIRHILEPDLADIACHYWGVTEEGNFAGASVLHAAMDLDELAASYGRELGELRLLLGEARARLFAARARRPRPARDEKILSSWNGLMISAFARSYELFHEEADREAAERAATFIREHLQHENRLASVFCDGKACLNGYLDDYAFMAAALVDLYEATQERNHLHEAVALAEAMIEHFWDREGGGFFFTSDDHEELIVRTRPTFDGSIPSGNSVALRTLLRLHYYTGNKSYRERTESALLGLGVAMREQPFALAHTVATFDFWATQPVEITLVGETENEQTRLLLEQIQRVYLPNRVLCVVTPGETRNRPPFAAGKSETDGRPTVYVCRQRTCAAPVHTWAELAPLLRPRR